MLWTALAPAAATATDYSVLLDTDNRAGTGCTASLPGQTALPEGIEVRVTASVDVAGGGTSVQSLEYSSCENGSFGPPTLMTAGYPVGLDLGAGGADVVELVVPLDVVPSGSAPIRLYFDSATHGDSDLLATANGQPGGPAMLHQLPFAIPSLTLAGLVLLSFALLLLARRGAGVLPVFVILVGVAGTALAAGFILDGQPGDWAGEPVAGTDLTGDATDGSTQLDIIRGFVGRENGRFFFRIDVANLDASPPVAAADAFAGDEDSVLSPAAPGVLANDTDPESDPLLAVAAAGTSAQGAAFQVFADGSFTYNPTSAAALQALGASATLDDSFSYQVSDGTGVATGNVTVTVSGVNDPPVAASDAFNVDEDSSGNALDVLANDTDVENDGLTITTTGAPDQGGSVTVNVTSDGLVYTPAANFSGAETFTYTISDGNGGNDTGTVTVTVSDVNDPPTISGIADQTIPEDGATGALAFTVDDTESAAGLLTVSASSSNQVLVPDGNLTLGGTGANRTITVTPAADKNGSADITLTVDDPDGGSDTTTFLVTVTSGNDAPSISAIADQVILEDATTGALAFTVDDVETPAGSLTVSAASGNTAIIPDANLVLGGSGANRTIAVTPLPDANGGPVTITVTVQDADGGSTPGSFGVTIMPVNDEPAFTAGGDVASDEDVGAQTVTGWATGITDGDGGTQVLVFNVTNNTNPGLFGTAPAVDPATGNLTYTSAPDANGSAEITVELTDDGGTANGGDNASTPATFTIMVNPINDPPQVTAPGPFNVTGNVRIQVPDGVDDLLAGANDTADGGASTLTVTNGAVASTQGGDVSLNADGTFRYDPPAGYEGADSFNFEVCDDGVGTPASACTTATVNLNVSDMVWFVDPSASAGDGRLNSPFNDVDALDAAAHEAGDHIFLHAGAHDGQLTLENGQHVHGEGATSDLETLTGIALPTYSDAFPATAGARPTWIAANATALTVAQDNALRGFDIGNTGTGTDIAGSNFGTLTISELDLLGSGQALDLNTGTLAGTIGAITSTSGSRNVSLVGVGGTPTFGGGDLSGAANQAFFVDGGTGTFSYPGTITNTTSRVVEIRNKTGGGVTLSGSLTSNSGGTGILVTGNSSGIYTFSGTSKTLNTGANPAVTLTSNAGAAINMAGGGMDIDTTTGTGLTATGGGSVTVTGANNTIDAAAGQAVNIVGTTIGTVGAGPSLDANGILVGDFGMDFLRVSAGGGTSGVVLDNAGAGGFRVTGDATTAAGTGANNDSGGQFTGQTGDGVALTDVSNVSLDQVRVQGAGGHGIDATRVTNLTLQRANLVNNGDANFEHGLRALNAAGEVTVTNTLADGNFDAHFRVFNQTGNDLTLFSVDDSTLRNVTTGSFEDGISFEAQTGVMTALAVTNSTFNNHDGDHVQASSNGTAIMDVDISGNTMTGTATNLGAGITVNSAGTFSGLTTFLIDSNDIQKAVDNSASINVNVGLSTTGGAYTGTISNNTIGTSGLADSAGDTGIAVEVNRDATMTVAITNNLINEFDNMGIDVGAVDGVGMMNATLRGNTVASADANAFGALFVDAQTTNVVCADVGDGAGGANSLNAPNGFSDVALQTGGSGNINLDGYVGPNNSQPDIQLYLQNRNPGGITTPPATPVQLNSGNVIQGGGDCPLP